MSIRHGAVFTETGTAFGSLDQAVGAQACASQEAGVLSSGPGGR